MLFLLLAGCSGSLLFDGSLESNDAYSGDTAFGTDEASEDSDFIELAWWRIHAEIEIEEFGFGTDSLIEFWFYDGELQPVCSSTYRLELLQTLSPPFEDGLLWWEVQLRPYSESAPTDTSDTGSSDTDTSDTGTSDTGTSDTGISDTGSSDTGTSDTGSSDTGSSDTENTLTDCPSELLNLPQQFQLGVGGMHPEIVAAWDDIDWGEDSSVALPEPNLTASYLSFNDPNLIYVFGTVVLPEADMVVEDWNTFQGNISIYSAYPFEFQF